MNGRRALRAAAIAVGAAAFLLPLAFMVAGSLRVPGRAPPAGFEWLPDGARWANYRDVSGFVPIWRQLASSLAVVAVAVPVSVLVASWAGFAIATAPRRPQRRLIVLTFVAVMVPASALWVPRFVMFHRLGLTDTLWPLVAPALVATSPFNVLIMALAYARIPRHLYDAARLDGLSPFGVWRRVAFPLGKPAAFVVAVLAFVYEWANFVDPLLYLSSPDRFTLPLGLRALQTLEPTNHPILLAGSVIVTLPAVVAMLAAQRAFLARTLRL